MFKNHPKKQIFDNEEEYLETLNDPGFHQLISQGVYEDCLYKIIKMKMNILGTGKFEQVCM
jgi:hypothetical protein